MMSSLFSFIFKNNSNIFLGKARLIHQSLKEEKKMFNKALTSPTNVPQSQTTNFNEKEKLSCN